MIWAFSAHAQPYAFPSIADHAEFYPTAYYDHGGVTDWNCDSITYSGHRGNDFGAGGFAGMDAGREITAAAPGVVTATNDGEFDRCTTADCPGGGGFGNYVYVEHPDGRTTIYGHLKSGSVAVSVGDAVVCGTRLGEMGSSGFSTGPHLHFEVRDAGNVAQEAFLGPCGSAASSWVDQGIHGEIPSEICGEIPECVPAAALVCGEPRDERNDGPGALEQSVRYGCVDFSYSGPERAYTLVVDHDQPVTLAVTGVSADLDLFVLDSRACDGTGCVGASSNPDASDELVAFDAVAGTEYTVVVDGWEGAVSDYHLEVGCTQLADTGLPEPTTGPLPTDTGPGPASDGETADTGDAAAKLDLDASRGCGCGGSFGASGAAAVGIVGLFAGRRRR